MLRRELVAFLGVLGLGIPTASRAEYIGDLRAKFNANGRTITLLAPYAFVDSDRVRWDVPSGAIVDGASIPKAFYSFIGGPLDGLYRDASVIHDWYCDRRSRPWQSVHRVFYEAMQSSGVEPWRAKVMYAAVQKFGPRWSSTVVSNNELGSTRVMKSPLNVPGLPPPEDKFSASNIARVQALESAIKSASRAESFIGESGEAASGDAQASGAGKGAKDGVSVDATFSSTGDGVSYLVEFVERRAPSRAEAEKFLSEARNMTLSQIENL
jgi:hypothetical protein